MKTFNFKAKLATLCLVSLLIFSTLSIPKQAYASDFSESATKIFSSAQSVMASAYNSLLDFWAFVLFRQPRSLAVNNSTQAAVSSSLTTETPSTSTSTSETSITTPVSAGFTASPAATSPDRVIERIITDRVTERLIVGDISRAEVEAKLQQLTSQVNRQLNNLSSGSGGAITNVYQSIATSQRIDRLANTAITNPTINGGTVTNAEVSGTTGNFSGAVSGSSGTFTSAIIDISTTTSATTTNLYATNFTGGSAIFGTTSLTNLTVTNTSASSFAGNVGIGSTSPWAQLSVNPNGITGPAFAVGSSTKTDFVVTNSGLVGIGTQSPITQLTMKRTTTGQMELYNWVTDESASNSQAIYSAVVGTKSGAFYVNGSGASNANLQNIPSSANFRGGSQTTGGVTVGHSAAGPIIFYNDGFAFSNEKMRIASGGNVGIGTTTPWRTLSVTGSSDLGNNALAGYFTATSSSATSTFAGLSATGISSNNYYTTNGTFQFTSPYAGTLNVTTQQADQSAILSATAPNGKIFSLQSQNATATIMTQPGVPLVLGTADTERIRIDTSGNVGIGTTSPGAKLDVSIPLGASNTTNYGIRSVVAGGANSVNVAGYFSATGASANYALQAVGAIDLAGNITTTGTMNLKSTISSTLGNLYVGEALASTYDINNGGQIVLAGETVGQGVADSVFAYVKGVKENATYNNSLGGLAFGTQSTSAGQGVLSTVTEKMRISSGGNVGIGTTSPATTLSVAGNGYFTGGLGVGKVNTTANTIDLAVGTVAAPGAYKINGSTIASASTTLNNYFFAIQPSTLYTTMTGQYNTGVGSSVLGNLTTGNWNTAAGFQALSGVTTGSGNTALGENTLIVNLSGSENTAVGHNALINTTGSNNVAIGGDAGRANTSGSINTFLGYFADTSSVGLTNATAIGANATVGCSNCMVLGSSGVNVGIGTTSPATTLSVAGNGYFTGGFGLGKLNTTANTVDVASTGYYAYNGVKIAYGQTALSNFFFGKAGNPTMANMTGADNNALGDGSLYALTSGTENNAFGVNAGAGITTGGFNIAIGRDALLTNSTSDNNVAIGYRALRTTTAGLNVGIGQQAGEDLSTGAGSVFVGYFAGANVTTGSNNLAMGSTALGTNTTGELNMAIGYQALSGITGSNNVAMGAVAWGNATAGDNNIALGYQAGDNASSGNKNIIIGHNIDIPDSTGSNQLNIGNLIFGTGLSGTGTTIAGNVGIGSTSPATTLGVAGSGYFTGGLGVGILETTAGKIKANTAIDVSGGGGYYYNGVALNLIASSTNLLFGASPSSMNGAGNTLLGYQSGQSMTSGAYNVALGYQSLYSATSSLASSNIAIGYQAMYNATTSENAIAIGNNALQYNAAGSNPGFGANSNIAIGNSALTNNRTGYSNIAIGKALTANISGIGNVAIDGHPYAAMNANTTGSYNVALGNGNLSANTTGSANIGIGYSSNASVTTGSNNIGIGQGTLGGITTGSDNIALGESVGGGLTGASSRNFLWGECNTCNSATAVINDVISMGSESMRYATGSQNIAIGTQTMRFTTGSHNTGIGYQSMFSGLSTGNNNYNSAYGDTSLRSIGSGDYNTALGASAMANVYQATSSTAVGFEAGYSSGGNFQNDSLFGYRAGYGLTTGSNNLFLGYQTGYSGTNVTTGSNNIIIGHNITGTSSSYTAGLNIGNILFGSNVDSTGTTVDTDATIGIGTTTPSARFAIKGAGATTGRAFVISDSGTNENFTVLDNGNVGIGTTSPSAKLDVAGTVRAYSATANEGVSVEYMGTSGRKYSMLSCFNCGSAGLGGLEIYDATAGAARAYVAAGVNGWQTPSDRRLKSNIETLSVLDKIGSIRGTSYTLNDSGIPQIGVIAQEIKAVFPDAVSGSEEDGRYLGVSYNAIAAIALQGVKELNTKLEGIASTTYSDAVSGNVGIGTTSPAYKLHVIGDVAATSFVNISTRDAKTNISYLTDVDENDILTKIKTMKIARYHYISEDQSNPLRLGLIAEEAPVEVLSPGGKGVDIYKLTTFLLAGVQQQQLKLENLEQRIARLEAAASSTPSTLQSFVSSLEAGTATFLERTVYVREVVAEKVTAQNTLCVGKTCVTEDQLKTLLANANIVATVSSATSTTTSDTIPPVITLAGNNPATIQKGVSYIDLGATVTDNVSNNIGITVTGDQFDTSVPGTYIVTFSATDLAGNTATSTRSVVVEDPAAVVAPAPVPVLVPEAVPSETVATSTVATSTQAN